MGKSADGLIALKWCKEGRMDEIITNCTQDVRVTRELYLLGKKQKFLCFTNKAGNEERLPVEW